MSRRADGKSVMKIKSPTAKSPTAKWSGAHVVFAPALTTATAAATAAPVAAAMVAMVAMVAMAAGVTACGDSGPSATPDCIQNIDCDDENPCTDDFCREDGVCEHENNSAACDDGLFCNGSDTCSEGGCIVHVGDPCIGGSECADLCDEIGDTCNRPNGSECTDDGDLCTEDVCDGNGQCVHPASSLCDGLISWWTFDEGEGATVADNFGGNHGQLVPDEADGPRWRTNQNGRDCVANGCLVFDGEDDGVACGDDPSLAISTDTTISLWFSPNSWYRAERLLTNGVFDILHRGEWAGDRVYFLLRIEDEPDRGDSAWAYKAGVHSGRDLPLGQWHHLVAVKRGQSMELWIDGTNARTIEDVLEGTAVSTSAFAAVQIATGPEPFSGLIDDVRLYDRPLSAAEICRACEQFSASAGVRCCEDVCLHEPAACTDAACSDGVDNDGDGLIDAGDPGCMDATDVTETWQTGDFQGLSIDQLRQEFDSFFSSSYPNGIIDTFPYNLSRPIAGLVSMYEATQDPTYIELALLTVEAVFDKMVDVDGDGYLEWDFGPSQWDHDGDPTTPTRASCLYTQKSVKHFARLARVIQHDDTLAAQFGTRAAALVSKIKTHIINDPYCRGRFLPGYSTVHHIVSHPVGVLLELYLLEGDQTYLDGEPDTYLATITAQADLLLSTIFPQLDNDQAVEWASTGCVDLDHTYPDCYFVNMTEHPACTDSNGTRYCSASDVSHGNEFVFTAIELYRAGIGFTRSDMDALVYTFMNKVWDGDRTYPNWRDFIDGHNEPPGGRYGPWRMGRNIAPGWVGLAAFKDELQLLFEWAHTDHWTNGQEPDRLGQIAFYGEIARNKRAQDCQYTNGAAEIPDGVDNDCDGLTDE